MTDQASVAPERVSPLAPAAILIGCGAGLLVARAPVPGALAARLFPVAVLGLLGLWIALTRFELFLLVFVVARPAADALTMGGISVPQAAGFLFLFASLSWLVRQRQAGVLQPFTPGSRAVLLVATVGMLSSLASVYPTASLQAGIKILGGALMFLVLAQLLATRPDLAIWITRCVLLSAVVPAGLALTQLGLAPTTDASGAVSRVKGTFVHPNPFAVYLVIVIVVAVAGVLSRSWYDRLLRVVVVGPALVALIGTGARGAWLGLVLALFYVLARRHPRLVLPLAALLVVVGLSTPMIGNRLSDLNSPPPVHGAPANSLQWRWEYWQRLPPLAADRPITGIGLETVQLVMPEKLQPHSVWVQSYTELGVLGVITMLTLVGTLAAELRTRRRRAGPERAYAEVGIAVGLALLLQSLTENLLTQPVAYWYFAAACAYGLRIPLDRAPADATQPATAECG